jgi:hypothetical protein
MKTMLLLAAGALALSTTACATGPEFRPLKGGVGYSDTQLQADKYQVSFAGDSSTPRDKVEQFLLLRAAQLTLANGFDQFVVVSQATDKSTEYRTFGFGPRWVGPGWYRPGWHAWWRMDPVLDDATTVPSNRFNATATIMMRKGDVGGGRDTYDARQLVASLAPALGVPAAAP